MMRVAFQGERGAYSEEAIRQHFGSEPECLPVRRFEDVFEAVESGAADHGMQPVENSTSGSINQAYDLLLEHDLRISGEVILRVRHALLALPGVSMEDVRRVRSHPQGLAQCQRYLNGRAWVVESAYDTAGSAKELQERPERDVAVIASRLAGQVYALQELDYPIEDIAHNYTRFFVLAREDPPRAEQSKTSVVFSARHIPGSLHRCLGEFANRGINLTKIESRPRRDKLWHYVFYLDFEGCAQDQPCADALAGLLQHSSFVKVLGSYAAAVMPEE